MNKMHATKNFRRISLHPVRILVYLLTFAVNIFFYVILSSYYLWMFAVIMLLYPIISIIAAVIIQKYVNIKLNAGQAFAFKQDELPMQVCLSNSSFAFCLSCNVFLKIINSFYGDNGGITVSLPVKPRSESSMYLPLSADRYGTYIFKIQEFSIRDLFGMIEIHKKAADELSITILPDIDKTANADVSSFFSYMTETEESNAKGNDFSEISDIREYVPGDKLRDIHWKLSARVQKYMVKERISVAGSEMVILIQFSDNPVSADKILEAVWGISHDFIAHGLTVKILSWNQRDYVFDEYPIKNIDDMSTAFADIYRLEFLMRQNADIQSYMKNLYPFLNNYLCVKPSENESTGIQILPVLL
jgi:uncharacterized protein (DUF58 family)